MGVKGLQFFLDHCCPEACVRVNLREMAREHAAKVQQGSTSAAIKKEPTLVVDGMACLRHWYTCKDWVCGGQWKEYVYALKSWVTVFTSAGINLVFFFDGVVEEQKRPEWVKRRRRVNRDIFKVFCHIKQHGEQPGGELFCLPSALATFTPFALRSLGLTVFRSEKEADYEIAAYAAENHCMGILGQDSDFIIFESAPYLSLAKLSMDTLTTVMYDQQKLCQTIGLPVRQLKLLAGLLGNDMVSEERMQHVRDNAMAFYRESHPQTHRGDRQGQVVLAVSKFLSSMCTKEDEATGNIPRSLNLSTPQRELLGKGIWYYLLPWERSLELDDIKGFENHVSPEILQACRDKHVAAEGFMVYNIVCHGVTECSNTLEDEHDSELLPQALVYKPCRQRIYGLVLLGGESETRKKRLFLVAEQSGHSLTQPVMKEWFVFPGNVLNEPELVHPVPVTLPWEDQLTLEMLWFSTAVSISALRLKTFLSIFGCIELYKMFGVIEDSLLAALCLVTYIVLQVQTLSQEDVDAYLSQAVCLRLKTNQELQQIELPFLCSRAVQLGSLYVRGLSHLLGANCASGCPLPSAALMPWQSFDGRLFHSKYLLAHSGTEGTALVDEDPSCLSLFLQLRDELTVTCRKRGRILQSRPQMPQQNAKTSTAASYRDGDPDGAEGWRRSRPTSAGRWHEEGWRERERDRRDPSDYEDGESTWWRDGHRGGRRGRGGPHNMRRPPRQSRGRVFNHRGRYQLAPRWSQPHRSGT
ncbi:constitutive coactivator of peroxisome proliferator-activated receptor gamma isoform X2 [Gouania willdenowi]|uniref:constitutive coactivator of peroxisome proliferator-activated receptor gamma isoform X2 n=1 Tax=Gouania willdenowi TaxID=441366 RepID=UPI0010567148|nr:constitutive coactivator of peroxisome proliferator-activated receptor gamma isoform X2 [Gouania willdenowi]